MPDNLPKLSVVVSSECSGVIIGGRTRRSGRTILQSDNVAELLTVLSQSPNLVCKDRSGNEVPRSVLIKHRAQLVSAVEAAAKIAEKKKAELVASETPDSEPDDTPEPDNGWGEDSASEPESKEEALLSLLDGDSFPLGNAGLVKLMEFAEKYGFSSNQLKGDDRSYSEQYAWLKAQFTNP